mmetsp:Transcript_98096/g.311099  ORF Transcript_98096/g.311099 Transcript_98096/m.311099 type:complete len:112 (-) Transcript_98096:7-342(-)
MPGAPCRQAADTAVCSLCGACSETVGQLMCTFLGLCIGGADGIRCTPAGAWATTICEVTAVRGGLADCRGSCLSSAGACVAAGLLPDVAIDGVDPSLDDDGCMPWMHHEMA